MSAGHGEIVDSDDGTQQQTWQRKSKIIKLLNIIKLH